MTETALHIYQKLNLVQSELKAPKGQYNKFGKYKYRNAEDILEAVKPLNHKYGLNLTISDETQVESNGWTYVVSVGTLVNIEIPTQKIVVTGRAREAQTKKGMDDSQVTGATSSYARKYMLNGLYLIDDTKDADTDQYHNQQQAPTNQQQSQPNNQQWDNQRTNPIEGKRRFLNDTFNEFFKSYMTSQIYASNLAQMIGVDDVLQADLSALVGSSKQLRKQIQDQESNKQQTQQAPQNNFKWGQQ